MSTQDLDYYRMRERKERESAERCDDMTARRVHLEMADRYSEKVRDVEGGFGAAAHF
jgi:hypothetical protein